MVVKKEIFKDEMKDELFTKRNVITQQCIPKLLPNYVAATIGWPILLKQFVEHCVLEA